jgi:peroxiredoxin
MAAGVPSIHNLINDYFGRGGDSASGPQHQRDLIPVRSVVPTPVGREATPFTLPNLNGEPTSLDDFAGQRLLVMFWNPGCGFCTQILDEVRRLEAIAKDRSARFVFVSEGPIEANRELGLESPVLIDRGFATGTTFGAQGTPSAIIIDSDGLIGSELAVGGPAVLALADGITAEPNNLDNVDVGSTGANGSET